MYLKNAWYVGAWGHEITREPMQRFMLDEPLVFYRRVSGVPVVLDDRCIHRLHRYLQVVLMAIISSAGITGLPMHQVVIV